MLLRDEVHKRSATEHRPVHVVLPSPVPLGPGLGPSSVETTPEKISSRYAFPRGWEPGFVGGEKSKPPSGTKMQPTCQCWKPLFGGNGLASPIGDFQICSEVGNSRGRVLVPDCPLPALQRHSNILELYSMTWSIVGLLLGKPDFIWALSFPCTSLSVS